MQRPRLALLLILAFVAAIAAPVHAAWVCPDGTPCVMMPARAAKAERTEPASCCKKHSPQHRGNTSQVSQQDCETSGHCRFAVMAKPDVTGTSPVARVIEAAWVAMVPVPLAGTTPVLETTVLGAWPVTADYRPPPRADERPARAPPILPQS